jgi:hypothetical protein
MLNRKNIVTNASSFGDIGYVVAVGDPEPVDNPTIREALKGPHVEDWRESIHNETVSVVMREVFQVVDLPEGRKALRSRYVLKLKKYARTLVKGYRRYLKAGTKHRATVPMTRNVKLTREEQQMAKQQEYVDAFPYQKLLGSLQYLAVNTRPDIAFAVNPCARFSNSPTYAACRTLIQILDYVSNTCTVGIVYRGTDFDIHGFCDLDWAGDIDTRWSTTGYLTFIAGGQIAWQSCLQTTVATSSMEAEYMAAYAIIQEICWLRGVLSDLGFNTDEPTKVYIDSKSAINLANNPVHHKRSKHIAIKYHWVRQMVNRHLVQLIHVSSEMQLADMLTNKALTEIIFNELTNRVLN